MNLTQEQLHTLRHMLGLDRLCAKNPVPYRNYYCANPGDKEMAALVEAGAVVFDSKYQGYEWFTATDAGREAAIASHRALRKPKPQRVYSKFLEISDVLPDLTFKQFITSERFAETRRMA